MNNEDEVLKRALHCCENCGARNHSVIKRHPVVQTSYIVRNPKDHNTWINRYGKVLKEIPESFRDVKWKEVSLRVVRLGIRHWDGSQGSPKDETDNRSENFAALCQDCAARYKNEFNEPWARFIRSRHYWRWMAEMGQKELF